MPMNEYQIPLPWVAGELQISLSPGINATSVVGENPEILSPLSNGILVAQESLDISASSRVGGIVGKDIEGESDDVTVGDEVNGWVGSEVAIGTGVGAAVMMVTSGVDETVSIFEGFSDVVMLVVVLVGVDSNGIISMVVPVGAGLGVSGTSRTVVSAGAAGVAASGNTMIVVPDGAGANSSGMTTVGMLVGPGLSGPISAGSSSESDISGWNTNISSPEFDQVEFS